MSGEEGMFSTERWLQQMAIKPLSEVIDAAKKNLTTSERGRLLVFFARWLNVSPNQIVQANLSFVGEEFFE